jgi:capsular exopolysaccharide synthesis family protein
MQLTLNNHATVQATVQATGHGDGTGVLARLARRKIWFLLGFSFTAATVAAVFTALPRTYRASAAVMVASNQAVMLTGTSSADAQRMGDPADIESQMLMLRSPRLARVILDDPEVMSALVADCKASREGTWATRLIAQRIGASDCDELTANRQALLQRIADSFSIGPTGRSRVIEVSFVSSMPETSVILANALVTAYLRDDKERKVDTHDNAINWLNSEIDRSGQELRKAELAVETYRSQHGIVRGQQASIISERLSALSQQLGAAQAAAAQAISRLTQFSGGLGDAQEVLVSRTVSDLKQQSAQLGGRRAELRQRYGDDHPSVLAINNQQREVEQRLDQEIRRVGGSLQRDAEAAYARSAELKKQFAALMQEVGNTGGAEADIAIMVRDVEARREIYVEQLKKVNILQTERRLLTGDAGLVHYAELPERPWFPKKVPFIAVGLAVASVVGASVALLRDTGDRTLRATTNLPHLSGVPIVGFIPRVRQGRNPAGPFPGLRKPSHLQESVRALFSRCVLVPGNVPRTLMVGSSDVGEGKTFLTLAMALFAATTGRRVLVIETDLRRPTFGKVLQLPSGVGLSEYLHDGMEDGRGMPMSSIVSHYHGLDIIAAGKPAMDSTELLSSSRLDSLLAGATAAYDLVILDSPPSLLLMDAQVLARRVDGILYCASFGRSRLDRILQGIRELSGAGGKVLGIVVGGGTGGERLGYAGPGMDNRSYLPAQP